MVELRFGGQVAVVTGAGRGLGRAYAEAFGARGAKVVVNDPGVGLDGTSGNSPVAESIARAIVERGGEAIANTDAVGTDESATSIIEDAVDAFGRVDVIVNNAGIFLPPVPFEEATLESYEELFRVHVLGTVSMARAAWPVMSAQRYGKIVNITSGVSIFGTRGRLQYATAKGAINGLTVSMAHESLDYGIYVNAVSPAAQTRALSASTNRFAEKGSRLSPELVAPAVLWLSHRDTMLNGVTIHAAAGAFTELKSVERAGFFDPTPTPEAVRDHADEILIRLEGTGLNSPSHAEKHAEAFLRRYSDAVGSDEVIRR